jgi:hypothetical protein
MERPHIPALGVWQGGKGKWELLSARLIVAGSRLIAPDKRDGFGRLDYVATTP